MKITRFAERHPYWFLVILEIAVIFVYLTAGTIAHFLSLPTLGLYGLANFGLIIIVASLLTVMKWWKPVGFHAAENKGDLLYFLVPFLPAFVNLIPGVEVSNSSYVLEVLIITMMVGFAEEGIFRGLMLHPLSGRGPWKAALLTALLFGLTHALNLLAGKSPAENFAQIYFALAIGFSFAILVLKTGILWPLILAHWAINFVNFIQKPGAIYPAPWNVVVPLSLAVIFTAYGLFVMLRYKPVIGRTNVQAPLFSR